MSSEKYIGLDCPSSNDLRGGDGFQGQDSNGHGY
jgi:hypothetical protein